MAEDLGASAMYSVNRNGKTILESDACGIGFLCTRKGVPERAVVEAGLALATKFDHRGAPGHGAGVQLDIPWPLLLDRFGEHSKVIAQRDVALGMFFLPFEAVLRQRCVAAVEDVAELAGVQLLQWADVPVNPGALDPQSSALRTLPIVRQAIFQRPVGLSEDGWFVCRYLLRLAIDRVLGELAGDQFAICSLSNRTVVYKGLSELSRIGELYPDLLDPQVASRYVLFHSRYCTNTTTAWRRAQPFWGVAHNGEINTIVGNVAWMDAIGVDLLKNLGQRYPSLADLATRAESVICSGGSDTANLDDMVLALMAGGMTLAQAVLALLPPAAGHISPDDPFHAFAEAAGVYLGACDGPAAIVACDGDFMVAHLDRNGLRPLWVQTSEDYVLAASELTGTVDLFEPETQRVLGPGEMVVVSLRSGRVSDDAEVRKAVVRAPFASPANRIVQGESSLFELPLDQESLERCQVAFGMTKEDLNVVIEPMAATGKAPVGSMGDDTSPSALLDVHPRRLEDHFSLRFAQETSPPIDPIRDAWVFDLHVVLGERAGLWTVATGNLYRYESRILSLGQTAWLGQQVDVKPLSLLFDVAAGPDGLESALDRVVQEAVALAQTPGVLLLTDRFPTAGQAALPAARVASRIHTLLVAMGLRSRVGIVADVGVWDVHHCALLVTLGADAVCPWLGCLTSGNGENSYLDALRLGVTEAMSMAGITPASAYCGARLVEAIGLDEDFLRVEFPNVPGHLGGIGPETLDREWLSFHERAFGESHGLVDAGEYRHTKEGRRHFNNAEIVRSLHLASGYAKKIHAAPPGSREAYDDYARLVNDRNPITVLDLLDVRSGTPIPLEEVEPEEAILWRFMAPGMSEGALSEPAHRSVARAFNLLHRLCRLKFSLSGSAVPPGIGPIANSGEGGFDKARVGTRDANRSVQYAGGRFTITPGTAATAAEAEVKFAQGAKPGKGGQLPGAKVSRSVAQRRGCEPGYELVSPPVNHNLYSIEDVKLMLESWRHLNPDVNCALKFVATYGVEMVAVGGVNAGANRIHLSDGCGGTGAAKRVDQKHAGVPVATALPTVHDLLVEEGLRHLVELSVDGGVQSGRQVLKLMLLGADRVGFGTSLLVAIGCSMLRKCHLSGPDPADPTGKRRLGCTPGVATQDPVHIAKFSGNAKHIARMLRFVAAEVREEMAAIGVRRVVDLVGRRDLLQRKPNLEGKAAMLDLGRMLGTPHGRQPKANYAAQTTAHQPERRMDEAEAAVRALAGEEVVRIGQSTNNDRCIGVAAAGVIARANGDLGLSSGKLCFEHTGAAGHFYGAYSVIGMEFRLQGVAADSCFTAAYGGLLVVTPFKGLAGGHVIGNAFAYGARGGEAYLAGQAGNRFGICLRKSSEGTGIRLVVEGVGANAFQYMTGGTALVLGPTGANLGAGMTGGVVYLLDADLSSLNKSYVGQTPLDSRDVEVVQTLLRQHLEYTGSCVARELLAEFQASRFSKVQTTVKPVAIDEPAAVEVR